MDRTGRNSFRVPPASSPSEPPSDGSGTIARQGEGKALNLARTRLLPPPSGFLAHLADQLSWLPDDTVAEPTTCPQAQRARADAFKVATNSLACALAQGGCFGTCFALNNFLRATANPAVKVFAGLTPMAFAGLTAYTEREVRQALGTTGTRFAEPARWQDFISSAAFLAVNMSYQLSKSLPKPAPTTPAGAAMTLMVSITATGTAGGLVEAMAQHAQKTARQSPPPLPGPRATDRMGEDEVRRRAVGRSLSLGPMAIFNQLLAAQATPKGQVSPALARSAIAVASFGWGLRHQLMPPARTEQPPTQPGQERP